MDHQSPGREAVYEHKCRLKCYQLVNFNQRLSLRRLLGVHLEWRVPLVHFLATRRINVVPVLHTAIALEKESMPRRLYASADITAITLMPVYSERLRRSA
jgi:hypothetical protein